MGGAMGDQKEKENKKKKEKKKISDEDSSERSAQSEPLVVALDPSAKDVFPVIGPPGLWRCPTNLLEELFDPANYPGIDAKTEFLKARMYVIGNERKRKTRGGMKRYLVGWFGRAQDNAGARNGSNGSFAARPLTQAQRVAEIAQRLRTLELEGKDPKLSDL